MTGLASIFFISRGIEGVGAAAVATPLLAHLTEIRALHYWSVEGCALSDPATDPGLAIGALPVAASYAIESLDALVPKRMPPIPLVLRLAGDEQTRQFGEQILPFWMLRVAPIVCLQRLNASTAARPRKH